ncbi:response regulator transcription factor [Lachnoanaerobaculum saburreum]|uniref:Stage 0 sporulation protein A homolog n=1 Tax=Lachnoanaerobaculum saburreum DSM 3986 TaxID=887325 RepID=E6LJM1_9FIRM|nr:response regulator transcription factor [Lachnoanaerobaculum saburreum]EFU77972.1 response regulator receiver domain protein [Lachnoanaerobaculum saburreum DSM 3986]
MNILIVEDEVLLASSLKEIFEECGHSTICAYDGMEGLELARSSHFDILVLDLMLPKLNGFQVARTLRKEKNGLPILMLTAKSDILDRVEGLDSGADYYLTKPFDRRELLACVNALLRRHGKEVNQISYGNTTLDIDSGELISGENSIRLSSKEFQMMRLLLKEGKNNISKNLFLEKIWEYDSDATENNVEVYIGFLRKKLKTLSSDISIIASRGLGYHLEIRGEK